MAKINQVQMTKEAYEANKNAKNVAKSETHPSTNGVEGFTNQMKNGSLMSISIDYSKPTKAGTGKTTYPANTMVSKGSAKKAPHIKTQLDIDMGKIFNEIKNTKHTENPIIITKNENLDFKNSPYETLKLPSKTKLTLEYAGKDPDFGDSYTYTISSRVDKSEKHKAFEGMILKSNWQTLLNKTDVKHLITKEFSGKDYSLQLPKKQGE